MKIEKIEKRITIQNETQNTKRFPGICLAAFLCAACMGMAGCGGTATGSSDSGTVQEMASGGAVSGTSVTGGEASPVKGTCCTGTNLYTAVREREELPEGAEKSGFVAADSGRVWLVQMRLDGSCKKKIDLGEPFSSLIGVAGSWIYYTTVEWTSGDERLAGIWRVPVRKGADGYDEVDTARAEKLAGDAPGEVYDESCVFADERYLLYFRNSGWDGEETVVVYDLQKRREVSSGFGEAPCNSNSVWDVWRLGEQYAVLMDEDLMVMPPDVSGWKQALGGGYMKEDAEAYNNRFLFYECFPVEEDECDYTPGPDHMNRDQIRVCDGREDCGFVTRKELKKAVESAVAETGKFSVDELGEWCILNLFCDGDRCYIQVQATGMHDGTYYLGCLVFSKRVAGEKIRYERELTRGMRECAGEWEGRWYGETKKEKKEVISRSVVNPAYCINAVNGNVYFWFYDKENNRRQGWYNSATGQVSETAAENPVWYERFYNGAPLGNLDLVAGDSVEEEMAERPGLPEEDIRFELTAPPK